MRGGKKKTYVDIDEQKQVCTLYVCLSTQYYLPPFSVLLVHFAIFDNSIRAIFLKRKLQLSTTHQNNWK